MGFCSVTAVNRGTLAVVSGQIAKENKDAMKVKTPTSLLAARVTRIDLQLSIIAEAVARSTAVALPDQRAGGA